jgi:hypothetical protein
MKINVCGKYELDLIEPSENQSEHSYFKYLKNAEKNSLCFEQLMIGLPTGMSVIEHFGGVGMTGVIIDAIIEPSSHLIFDIDADCIKCLKNTWGDNARYGDAKELIGTMYADLVTLDFPNANALHYNEWHIDRLFNGIHPKYITIADIARQRIGLHRKTYSKFFCKDIQTNEDYMQALSEKFYNEYGYSIRKCAYHIHSFLLLSVAEPTQIEYWHLENVPKRVKEPKKQKEEERFSPFNF